MRWISQVALMLYLPLMVGCTTVTYPTIDGPVSYTSFLTDRKLESLTVSLSDGTKLTLREYTSEQAQVAGEIAEGIARGLR